MSGEQPFSLFETIAIPAQEPRTPELASPEQSGSSLQGLVNLSGGVHRVRAPNVLSTSASSSLSGSTSYNYAQTNLIVNYIPVEVTEEEFRQLFAQFGEIESSKIVVDRTTGYTKGYGFVRFVDPAAAVEAMNQLDGFPMYNKRLKVGLASRQNMTDSPSPVGSKIILREDKARARPHPGPGLSFPHQSPFGGASLMMPGISQPIPGQPMYVVSPQPVYLVPQVPAPPFGSYPQPYPPGGFGQYPPR